MKNVIFNDKCYELIENYKDGYNQEEIENKLTDYYDGYDYILGDWAYGKLRLKGFYNSDSANVKEYNDIANKDTYLKNECAFECSYFLMKKIKDYNK